MRQLDEKRFPSNIELAALSDNLDLLAVADEFGIVTVYRINRQCISTLDPPASNTTVILISWRPDGLALAIVYSNRELRIVEAEKMITVMKMTETDVCYLRWQEESSSTNRYAEYRQTMNDFDYIPKRVLLPSKDDETAVDNFKSLSDLKRLIFLFVGLRTGYVHIYVCGLYLCAVFHVPTLLNVMDAKVCEIRYVDIADNLASAIVVVDLQGKLKCLLVDCNQLSAKAQDLFLLMYKRAIFDTNLDVLDRTIGYIKETWNSILVETENLKLDKYPSGSLSDEFLQLMVYGHCSPSLYTFLNRELSSVCLQKLNKFVEFAHAVMKKLFLYHLQPGIENVMFDLTILQGMQRMASHCGKPFVEIEENAIEECLVAAGGYFIKSNEMLPMNDTFLLKYKSFLRWLSLRLSTANGTVATTNHEFTPRELNLIMQFICEIDENAKSIKSLMSLYLLDEDLPTRNGNGTGSWLNLLKENPILENCLLIMPSSCQHMSLVQLHKYLRVSGSAVFENFHKFVHDFRILRDWTLCESNADAINKISVARHDGLSIAFTKSTENKTYLNMVKIATAAQQPMMLSLYFNTEEYGQLQVSDLQFYANDVLSLLLLCAKTSSSFYLHFPVSDVPEHAYGNSIKNGFSMVSRVDRLKLIEGVNIAKFAVNGVAKLAAFVAENRRQLRVYEIESRNREKTRDLSLLESSETKRSQSRYGIAAYPDSVAKELAYSPNEFYVTSSDLKYFASLDYSNDEETNSVDGDFDVSRLKISSAGCMNVRCGYYVIIWYPAGFLENEAEVEFTMTLEALQNSQLVHFWKTLMR